MKILKVRTLYPAYLNEFYNSRPGLDASPYEVQKRALADDFFSWPETFPRYLSPYGYETTEVVSNNIYLQQAWMRETGSKFEGLGHALIAQVKHLRPDVIFCNDHLAFPESFWPELRSNAPSVRAIFGWCGVPVQGSSILKAFDYVVTCSEDLRTDFEARGAKCELLEHAFDPVALKIESSGKRVSGINFIGQLVPGQNFHGDRERYLMSLARNLPAERFRLYSSPLAETNELQYLFRKNLKGLARGTVNLYERISGSDLSKHSRLGRVTSRIKASASLDYFSTLKKVARPSVFGRKMLQLLGDSDATFNIHIGAAKSFACNMRLFEGPGMGACLLTDYKPNLKSLFDDGKEILAYKSFDECIEKAKWIVDHPEQAREIGKRGQQRVLREHTFEKRLGVLNDILKRRI